MSYQYRRCPQVRAVVQYTVALRTLRDDGLGVGRRPARPSLPPAPSAARRLAATADADTTSANAGADIVLSHYPSAVVHAPLAHAHPSHVPFLPCF